MGFFDKFRRMFNKDITIDDTHSGELVFKYPLKRDVLKINTIITVREGFAAVTVHYDKLCDILPQGSFRFITNEMPKLSRHMKAKRTKQGFVSANEIKCDLYFVNLGEFNNLKYKGYDKIYAKYKNKNVGFKIEGGFALKIADAESFIKTLLMDNAVIKNGTAEKLTGDIAAEQICEVCGKEKDTDIKKFIDKDPALIAEINADAGAELIKSGLTVTNITIDNVILPKSLIKVFGGTMAGGEPAGPDIVSSADVEDKIKAVDEQFSYAYAAGGGAANAGSSAGGTGAAAAAGAGSGNAAGQGQAGGTASATGSSEDYYEQFSKQFNESRNVNSTQEEPYIISGKNKEAPAKQNSADGRELEVFSSGNNKDEVTIMRGVDIKEGPAVAEEVLKKKSGKVKAGGGEGDAAGGTGEIKCTKCGAVLNKRNKFCPQCGTPTSGYAVCPACGAKNLADASVCMVCKSKLK